MVPEPDYSGLCRQVVLLYRWSLRQALLYKQYLWWRSFVQILKLYTYMVWNIKRYYNNGNRKFTMVIHYNVQIPVKVIFVSFLSSVPHNIMSLFVHIKYFSFPGLHSYYTCHTQPVLNSMIHTLQSDNAHDMI